MKIEFTVQGKDALKAALEAVGERVVEVGAQALHEIHEEIMTEAKGRVPVDTGALRASGVVFEPRVENGVIISEGGFGGAAVEYAIPVHERLDVFHPNGEAKFYERPIMERAPDLEDDLAEGIQRRLGQQ